MAYATNRFPAGSGPTFTIAFDNGYIDKAHVKAYTEDATTRARTEIIITPEMWVDAYTLDLGITTAVGFNTLILRDTPKDAPLVDFINRSRITEANLDKLAAQAINIGAETSDATSAEEVQGIYTAAGAVFAARDQTLVAKTAAETAQGGAETARTGAEAAKTASEAIAASINPANFATAAQGAKADSAVQPSGITNVVRTPDIGASVQAYDAATAKINVTQAWSKSQRGAPVTLTDAATVAVDLAIGNNFELTLGGNRTLGNPTNAVAGQSGIIVVNQDGTGNRTLAFGTNYKFGGGLAPTMSTPASAQDALCYYVISSTRIWVSLVRGIA